MTRFLSNTLIFTLLFLVGCSSSEYEYRQTITADVSNAGQVRGLIWKQVSGPAPSIILNPNKGTTDVLFSAIGFYDFELTVWNQFGEDKDTTQVTVLGPTLPLHLKQFKGSTHVRHNRIQWVYEADEPATYRLTRNGREIYSTFLPSFDFEDFNYETISKYQLIATTAAGRTYYSEILRLVNKQQQDRLRFAGADIFAYLETGGECIIQVFTSDGRMIHSQQGQAVAGVNRWTLPLDGWASGVYIARVQTENNVITGKFKR
ncbi:Secretion system C-terminal sorting domain [uncultured Caudovirales phage]|uniref:Secretion system C-terminal sorting domain n=1 Tax=uncultured Caudovirales phage TaxID=2100421 RepID=A0A6J5M2J1_9CAUD|nr:Secretion system C-terminal sorting domain [uncultured Caudovirales phage]